MRPCARRSRGRRTRRPPRPRRREAIQGTSSWFSVSIAWGRGRPLHTRRLLDLVARQRRRSVLLLQLFCLGADAGFLLAQLRRELLAEIVFLEDLPDLDLRF